MNTTWTIDKENDGTWFVDNLKRFYTCRSQAGAQWLRDKLNADAADVMNEQKAREILGGWIQPDNSIEHKDGENVVFWHPLAIPRITDITGEMHLTANDLESIAWWMRNMGAK